MGTSAIENLNFSMERIPGIEALSAIAAPASLATKGTQILELIEDRRLWYRLCHCDKSCASGGKASPCGKRRKTIA
jgi:hypothetical protein